MKDRIDYLQLMQLDLAASRVTADEVMANVTYAQELYEGKFQQDAVAKANGLNRHTRYAQKDIMRVVESSLPDLTSPFLLEDDIVVVQATKAEEVAKAEAVEYLLNKQFKMSVNKIQFIETIARNVQIQGTVFCKVGYEGGSPVVESVPINEIFIDPSARSMDSAKFVIQRSKVSVHDIRTNTNWYGVHSDEVYATLTEVNETEDDVNFSTGYGRDDSFNYDDRTRQLIEVFSYYGMADINGDGSLVPVLGIWSENTLLRFDESPYPEEFNGNPFECAVYNRKPYSVYGSGVAEMLETSQNLRQFISSAMVENVENNTVGQTFIPKNFLDPMNKKALLDGKRLIETNGPVDGNLTKGQFEDMPQSVFALNESLKAEQEELTGISRLNTGMDPRALNSGVTAAAVTTSNDNAAKRLLQITRHLGEMLERVFTKWIVLNQTYLENSVIQTREGEYVELNAGMIQGNFDINIKAGIAGDKEKRLRDLQMMLSLVSTAQVQPDVINKLIAEMAQILGLPVLAQELRQPIEENPMKDVAMNMEMMKAEADIQKTMSEAEENQADTMKKKAEAMSEYVSTELKSYGIN